MKTPFALFKKARTSAEIFTVIICVSSGIFQLEGQVDREALNGISFVAVDKPLPVNTPVHESVAVQLPKFTVDGSDLQDLHLEFKKQPESLPDGESDIDLDGPFNPLNGGAFYASKSGRVHIGIWRWDDPLLPKEQRRFARPSRFIPLNILQIRL